MPLILFLCSFLPLKLDLLIHYRRNFNSNKEWNSVILIWLLLRNLVYAKSFASIFCFWGQTKSYIYGELLTAMTRLKKHRSALIYILVDAYICESKVQAGMLFLIISVVATELQNHITNCENVQYLQYICLTVRQHHFFSFNL